MGEIPEQKSTKGWGLGFQRAVTFRILRWFDPIHHITSGQWSNLVKKVVATCMRSQVYCCQLHRLYVRCQAVGLRHSADNLLFG